MTIIMAIISLSDFQESFDIIKWPPLLSNNLHHVTLILISIQCISPVLSDHLSYVTLFQCPLERSHQTGLTVFISYLACAKKNTCKKTRKSTISLQYNVISLIFTKNTQKKHLHADTHTNTQHTHTHTHTHTIAYHANIINVSF